MSSELSLTYATLRRAIGRLLGYGRDPASWAADQTEDVDDILLSGLRKFYWPPTPDGPIYGWSFLRKTSSFTLAIGDFDYDLPNDFAFLCGTPVIFSTPGGKVARVSCQDLEAMRSQNSLQSAPMYCAVRALAPVLATGTRFELVVYPTPGGAVTLAYCYVSEPDTISTAEYPLGGAVHAEAVLQACLAAAEESINDNEGVHAKKFAEALAASIRTDRMVLKTDRIDQEVI